jgi:hypothetical protein
LRLPPKAHALDAFKWCVSFHGCASSVVSSILQDGLLMPGDTLIDGTELPNRCTKGGKERIQVYTSPSIKYAELDSENAPSPTLSCCCA